MSSGNCHCVQTRKNALCDLRLDGQPCCCWCGDLRTPEEISDPEIYLDTHGLVHPKAYGIKWKRDIGYCPKCRHSRGSSALLYTKLERAIKLRNLLE